MGSDEKSTKAREDDQRLETLKIIRTLGKPGVSFLFARKTKLIIENYILL